MGIAGEKPRPRRLRARHAPLVAAALLPSAAILWAHGENYVENAEVYANQPPTVSRALANPEITSPFAIAMIAAAALLGVAILQILFAMVRVLRDRGADRLSWYLLVFAAICEVPAILGMVVLSQYTGDALALQHDIGSHMLFFGHTFAIAASGWMIHRLLAQQPETADSRLSALRGLPRHAAWTAIFSGLFAVAYYSNGHVPAISPFWHHLVLSIIEIVVLAAFLTYLWRFWRLLEATSA